MAMLASTSAGDLQAAEALAVAEGAAMPAMVLDQLMGDADLQEMLAWLPGNLEDGAPPAPEDLLSLEV